MRLGLNQRRALHAAATAVLATGAAWLVLHYAFPADPDLEPGGHPAERTLLALHGAAAMAAMAAFGMLLAAHVPAGLRGSRNRWTGLALAGGAVLLAATGHALYYWGDEAWRPWIAALHWGVGLGLAPAFLVHRARGRWSASRHVTAPPAPASAARADAVAEEPAIAAARRRTAYGRRRSARRPEA